MAEEKLGHFTNKRHLVVKAPGICYLACMKTTFLLTLLFFTASGFATTFQHPSRVFSVDYNDVTWEVVPNGSTTRPLEAVDKTMADRTLVTFQRKAADDKYRARFSVVVDPAGSFTGTPEERLSQYQKHAVEFLKGQRFHIIDVKKAELTRVKVPAFEISANQRDFGLLFRQVSFLSGKDAYLLTAAARTNKFPEYKVEIDQLFNSFTFSPRP